MIISIEYGSYLQGEISRESDEEYETQYSYDDGYLSQVTHSIGSKSYNTVYTYNNNDQVETVAINGNSYSLGYDSRGYIAEVNYNGFGYKEYEYDNAGRLTKEIDRKNDISYTYEYENNNLTKVEVRDTEI